MFFFLLLNEKFFLVSKVISQLFIISQKEERDKKQLKVLFEYLCIIYLNELRLKEKWVKTIEKNKKYTLWVDER